MRPCFSFSAAASPDEPTTLSIYDEIGFWGVQAKDFISQLAGVSSSAIHVEINSPGGDVFAGLAIYNALKASGKEIVVKVMGVAASAASLIAMAGDKIQMPKNTFMMVHNPWSVAVGTAQDMRAEADVLDKIGTSLRDTYAARTGLPADEIETMLATDTWLTADEALAKGFATEVVENVNANAKFDMARADLPEAVRAVFKAQAEQPTAEELAALAAAQAETQAQADAEAAAAAAQAASAAEPLADQIAAAAAKAGFEAYSPLWAVACTSMVDVAARIDSAKEIKALCAVAKKADMADGFIKGNKLLDEVRAELVKALAHQDSNTHTDGSQTVNSQATDPAEKPKVSTASLWASHRGQKSERT